MNLIEEIRSLSDIEITLISFAILFGIFNICIVTKLVSIQEKLEEVSKELKGIKDNHISELKGETDVKTTYKGKPLKYAENGLHNKLKGK